MLAEQNEAWTHRWKREGAEEGRKEGRQEGLREGHRKGESSLLKRLLIVRFGPLPEWAERRMAEASEDLLEHWAERILYAATIEEVFENSTK